jgi:hypothetical protein
VLDFRKILVYADNMRDEKFSMLIICGMNLHIKEAYEE